MLVLVIGDLHIPQRVSAIPVHPLSSSRAPTFVTAPQTLLSLSRLLWNSPGAFRTRILPDPWCFKIPLVLSAGEAPALPPHSPGNEKMESAAPNSVRDSV